MHSAQDSTIVFLLFLIVINLTYLDIAVFTRLKNEQEKIQKESLTTQDVSEDSACPSACVKVLDTRLRELQVIAAPSESLNIPTSTTVQRTKELYIPIGNGIISSFDWTDITGAEVYIDKTAYQNVKTVLLEVVMHLKPGNGRMYVKLYNVTDKHDVWFSEMWTEGETKVRKVAQITLDEGNKLYRIMAKSTMGYDAYVDNARIKITTN